MGLFVSPVACTSSVSAMPDSPTMTLPRENLWSSGCPGSHIDSYICLYLTALILGECSADNRSQVCTLDIVAANSTTLHLDTFRTAPHAKRPEDPGDTVLSTLFSFLMSQEQNRCYIGRPLGVLNASPRAFNGGHAGVLEATRDLHVVTSRMSQGGGDSRPVEASACVCHRGTDDAR